MMEVGKLVRATLIVVGTWALIAGCGSPRKPRPLIPKDSDAKAAAQATAAKNWREAADRWYSIYLSAPGKAPEPVVETTRALLELKDFESANNLAEQGLKHFPENVDLLEQKGFALTALGFRRPAEHYFMRAHEVDPKRTSMLVPLARLRIDLGLESAALAPLQEVIAKTGGDATVYALLARASRSTGDARGSYQAWKRAFELGPPRVEDLLAAATICLDPDVQEGHPESMLDCRKWLEAAVAQDPQCTQAHFQLGVLEESNKAVDKAILHYRRAVETDDTCLMALTNLAILYSGRGDETNTRAIVARALKLEEDADRRRELQKLIEAFEKKESIDGAKPQQSR